MNSTLIYLIYSAIGYEKEQLPDILAIQKFPFNFVVFLSIYKNPIGKAGNIIATMKYAGGSNPRGYAITTQATLSSLHFYFRWHRESDDVDAYPPDGTEIIISYMIFY